MNESVAWTGVKDLPKEDSKHHDRDAEQNDGTNRQIPKDNARRSEQDRDAEDKGQICYDNPFHLLIER